MEINILRDARTRKQIPQHLQETKHISTTWIHHSNNQTRVREGHQRRWHQLTLFGICIKFNFESDHTDTISVRWTRGVSRGQSYRSLDTAGREVTTCAGRHMWSVAWSLQLPGQGRAVHHGKFYVNLWILFSWVLAGRHEHECDINVHAHTHACTHACTHGRTQRPNTHTCAHTFTHKHACTYICAHMSPIFSAA